MNGLDTVLTSLLAVGAGFLVASVVLYTRSRPWRSREGLLLFSILANFALVKIFALVLILDILVDLTQLWRAVMFTLVAINGPQIFFMILSLQRRRGMMEPIEEPKPVITPNAWISDPAKRRWLYGIAVAALAVAVFYKLLPAEAIPFWLDLLANILGISGGALALRNLPKA